MNIFSKSVMEHTDTQYNEYGDKVKEMQQAINFDLQEYKDVNSKVIRLDSLGKSCDILMNKAREKKENNIICKIINILKACIILISLYSAFTNVSPLVTASGPLTRNTINEMVIDIIACIVTIIIVSFIAKGANEVIKSLYDEKLTQLSLKKAVIESNYKQLSKSENCSSDKEVIEIKEKVVK